MNKCVERDFYAEKKAAEIAKLKIENDENVIKSKKISEPKADKISELELEIGNLKESNEKLKAEARNIKVENENNLSKKDLEINRLRSELLVFTDRYDWQFFKRVLSVLKEDREREQVLDEYEATDLVESLRLKPKLQVKNIIYEVLFNHAGECFDFEEDDTSAETRVALILGEIFTPEDPFKMLDEFRLNRYCQGFVHEMYRQIRIREADY